MTDIPQFPSGPPRIAVVDYDAGNLRSVSRALRGAGADVVITDVANIIESADAIVLPGVGAAGAAMRVLAERGLIAPLHEFARSGRPFLGVCLGLQVLMTASDEDGGTTCLGIIPGTVNKLPRPLKIPHIGWNQVEKRSDHRILEDIPDRDDFYFVHSFVAVPEDPVAIVGVTDYGVNFASLLQRGNVVATQFHPEKSADAGLLLYRNFVRWAAQSRVGATRAIGELV